ncbi:MAG: DUF309 domain-containing protein [Nitriliruptorales bacterium]|nr:DUF309 domain-containing protein [Nitriliruptorales bacterium]
MDTDDRDRNELGRPENARPRDRLGRPLPHGTDDVPLAETFTYETVEEALAIAVRLWDEQRFFEAHECLEDVWHHADDDDRSFWQGVIQVAITCCHDQRGNEAGRNAMARKALANLAGVPDRHCGIDVARLRDFLEVVPKAPAHPAFPAVNGGPWFRAPDAVTPLTRIPPWQAAAEQLAARAGR